MPIGYISSDPLELSPLMSSGSDIVDAFSSIINME
jgi:hypothetical protein